MLNGLTFLQDSTLLNKKNKMKTEIQINLDLFIAKEITGVEFISKLIKLVPFAFVSTSRLRQYLHGAIFHYELGDTTYLETVDYLYEIINTDYTEQEIEANKLHNNTI